MNKEDYILRITSATPVQLVVINHQILLDFIAGAIEASSGEAFEGNINKAKDALAQLMSGLNFESEIAHDLFDLYLYAGRLLNHALFSRDPEASAKDLNEVLGIFQNLLEGWEAIADTPSQTEQGPQNDSPQVYAGLTYEKDGLSEYVVQDDSRGFKA